MGDVTGGALFSFVLIFLFTPFQSLVIAGMSLWLCTICFCRVFNASPRVTILGGMVVPLVFMSGLFLEMPSLSPKEGRLVEIKESLYGRIAIHEDKGQFTLFEDGVPVTTTPPTQLAQEIVHYAMCQIPVMDDVLVISRQAGILSEIDHYHPRHIRYIELDPDVSRALMRYGMITPVFGLTIINEDARNWLSHTEETFHAVLMNMPEPDTFQANRFYTDEFFHLVHAHMADRGIFSFYVDGYDTYITETQLAKVSVIHATLKRHFPHVALIPSDNLFFLCGDHPIETDIPKCLGDKGMQASYLASTFYGNVSQRKIHGLMGLMAPNAPVNSDETPRLISLMYRGWFEKFSTSPVCFAMGITLLCILYLSRVTQGQYVLYTTGVIAMGSEILVIFLYQMLYGYLYFKIGMIVTLFLTGLLPGAFLGNRIIHRIDIHGMLRITDFLIISFLAALFLAMRFSTGHLSEIVLLVIGTLLSVLCGFQFPLASTLESEDNRSISGAFTADLMGASSGILIVSLVLIPYVGIKGALVGLSLIKLSSMMVMIWKPSP